MKQFKDKLEYYKAFLIAKSSEKKLLEKNQQDLQNEIKSLEESEKNLNEAIDIVNNVILVTQESDKGFIKEIVSTAIKIVYGEDYGFKFDVSIKRNQSEFTPIILKDGLEFGLRDEVGGGICDVCSFALRMALWALQSPRTEPILILDEPGRFVSRDKQPLFGDMLKSLSELMGMQIIMVSHSTDLINSADKGYEVTQENGISFVTEREE